MLITELLVTGIPSVLEQVVEQQFGLPGLIALLLLRTGLSRRSWPCVGMAIAVLTVLLLT